MEAVSPCLNSRAAHLAEKQLKCYRGVLPAIEDIVPGFLQTLLEGTLEQLYTGPISQYKIDDLTKSALNALKKCIDELSPEHIKALVDLLEDSVQ
uniref:Secretoglobin family 1C member 1 n=1 Tax=Apteryx owenii TaxID=8824 RepID=A0A8B9PL16_APTOW